MADKFFVIQTPDELYNMIKLQKDGKKIERYVRIWQTNRIRSGKTSWDGCFLVVFYTENRNRICKLILTNQGDIDRQEIATLKYKPALDYFRENGNASFEYLR